MTNHSSTTLNYIEAGSPKALCLAIRDLQLKKQRQYEFQDIQQYTNIRGKIRFVAFYKESTKEQIEREAQKAD